MATCRSRDSHEVVWTIAASRINPVDALETPPISNSGRADHAAIVSQSERFMRPPQHVLALICCLSKHGLAGS